MDVRVRDEGSIILVEPITEAAENWITENVQADAQYVGRSLVVEHRYAADLISGMVNDGLEVE